MGKKLKYISLMLTVMLLTLGSMTSIAYAYVTISYGYITAQIEVKNRSAYSNVFDKSLTEWYYTPTPAWIKEVVVSNNSIGDGVYADGWNGQYSADSLQYVFWGRATSFTISLNRRILVNESDNFKQSVMVHELGHALGLDDNPPQSQSIMRYDRDRNTMISPQSDDIDGVNYYYR